MFEPGKDDGLNEEKKNALDNAVNEMKGWGQKITDAFLSNFNPTEILKAALEVDQAGTRIAHSFGQGREQMVAIKGALTDAVQDVAKLGGSFDDIVKIQEAVSASLGRNVLLQKDSFDKLYAAQQVSGQDAKTIIESFKNAGISANQAGKEMENVVNAARSIGVSAEAVSAKVLANTDALNKYNFQGGVEGLAKMAAHATALRIDMGQTLNFAEKVFNPEGAIEVAAAMQRLGVAQTDLLDPLRLMDLSQNDPAELQKQMAEMAGQFVQLNEKGQFEIMPGAKRQLREIESAMGLASGSLSKMALGAAELDDKLSKIRFPDFATEEQKEMIANLAEMNDKGEYVIRTEKGEEKLDDVMARFQGDQEGFKEFIKQSQPKDLEEIQKEQLDYAKSMDASLKVIASGKYGLAGSETLDKLLEAPRKIQSGVAETLTPENMSPAEMRKFLDTNAAPIFSSIEKLVKGEGSLEDVFSSFSTSMGNTKKFLEEGMQQSLEKAKTSFDSLSTSSNEFLGIITGGVKKFDEKLNDGKLLGSDVNTKANDINTKGTENKMVTEEKKTHDINLNLTFAASGQGVDLSQITNNPKAMQDLTTAVKEALTSSGLINVNGDNQKNVNIQVKTQ